METRAGDFFLLKVITHSRAKRHETKKIKNKLINTEKARKTSRLTATNISVRVVRSALLLLGDFFH
jgi:hypothetical protein